MVRRKISKSLIFPQSLNMSRSRSWSALLLPSAAAGVAPLAFGIWLPASAEEEGEVHADV